MAVPSKELLSEVLGITEPYFTNLDELVFWSGGIYRQDRETERISVHEIVYKCKEWIINTRNKALQITYHKDCVALNIFSDDIDAFVKDTESEAVFEACEWILKQNEGNKNV